MSRRVSMPTADDLFRPTSEEADAEAESPAVSAVPAQQAKSGPRAVPKATPDPASDGAAKAPRTSSGRVRHDEKMTVYVTADELVDIEHARLSLRRDHGLAVDRGRLVREALAIVLADLELHGDDSELVRRLIG